MKPSVKNITPDESKVIFGAVFFICVGIAGIVFCDCLLVGVACAVYGLANLFAAIYAIQDESEHETVE